MGMDLMDVFVKIGADTSGLESGINSAKGMLGGIGSAVSTGMKVAGAAIATATTAVGAFAASSVEVGKSFDSSMAQVAATMGKSVDEIDDLREYAKEMGASTAFSASQAADALNYMALAGYDATQSMEMLPNVLNLAAAGDMELARASDMVTDAASALGFTLADGSVDIERTTELVDMMAKTSSKSNTSVAQLGDAILTVGGTAKALAGGTTELNTALGILADNGIKGSEGGTKLRNVILSLSAPTDAAAKALDAFGVKTADAEGNLRPLEDIMGDLSASLDGLGTTERADVISTIFNKTDIAAVNALLDTSAKRWDELSNEIDNAKGAAETMAETQLDNLEGDITKFKSALEGAQLEVSDKLTPSLRDFVQFGTKGLSEITDGFKEGGLTGAMSAFGNVLSEGLGMVTEKLPEAVNAGLELLEAFGKGLVDNAPVLLASIVEIGGMLRERALELLTNVSEGLKDFDWAGAAQKVVEFITNAFDGDSTGGLLQVGMDIMTSLLEGMTEALPVIVEGLSGLATDLLTTLVEKTAEFDWAGATQKIVDFIVQAFSGSTDGGFLQLGLQIVTNIIGGIFEALPVLLQGAAEILQQFANTISETAPTLIPQLVKMIGELAQALTEPSTLVSILNAAVQIVMALAQGILNAVPELLRQAPIILSNLVGAIVGALPTVISAGVQILNALITGILGMIPDLLALAPRLILALVGGIVQGIATIIQTGKQLVSGFVEGIKNAWTGAVTNIITFFTGLIDRVKALFGIHSPSKIFSDIGKNLIQGMIDGIKGMINKLKDKAKDILDVFKELPKKVIDIGKNIIEGVWEGMSGATDWIKQKITGWVGDVLSFFKTLFGIKSPSTVMRDLIGVNLGKGVAEGIEDSIPAVEDAMGDMSSIIEAPQFKDVSTVGSGYNSSASVLAAMGAEQDKNKELTVILELDRSQFARAVYQLNNDETQRVGMKLAGGFA